MWDQFSRHVDDIVSDNRIKNNDIVGFTEAQIKPSDSTCKIIETFNLFKINFSNNENKFLSLAYGCRNYVAVLNKFDGNAVSILSLKKHTFTDRVFTLMLVYGKQSRHMEEFFQMLQYLLATNAIYIRERDFNYDLLNVSQNNFLDIFAGHVQIVNKPTKISGSLIDHAISRKLWWQSFSLM